jgi:hypothetical protein
MKARTVNKKLLNSIRNLCPKGSDGITSITISTNIGGKEQSVTLTPEDRKRMDKILKDSKP